MSKTGDTLTGVGLLNLLPAGIAAIGVGAGAAVAGPLIGAAALLIGVGKHLENEESRRLQLLRQAPVEPPPLPPLDLSPERYPFVPTSEPLPGPWLNDDAYEAEWRRVVRAFLKADRNVRIRRYFMPEFREALVLVKEMVYLERGRGGFYITPDQHVHRARGVLVRRGILP